MNRKQLPTVTPGTRTCSKCGGTGQYIDRRKQPLPYERRQKMMATIYRNRQVLAENLSANKSQSS